MLHLLDRVIGLDRPRDPREEEDSERRAGSQKALIVRKRVREKPHLKPGLCIVGDKAWGTGLTTLMVASLYRSVASSTGPYKDPFMVDEGVFPEKVKRIVSSSPCPRHLRVCGSWYKDEDVGQQRKACSQRNILGPSTRTQWLYLSRWEDPREKGWPQLTSGPLGSWFQVRH